MENENKNKFYITTAIPYVNAAPHIGFALEAVQTDALARYHRALGDDTHFLTGTDENALKNVQAAEKAGKDTKEFVDENSTRFEDLKAVLNLSFDDFIRTTEERHVKGAQKFWKACDPDDIYKKTYKGLYCVGCEEFKTKKELIDGKCPEHGTVPEEVEEENYFFKLSRYQKQLEKLIEKDELKIIPETRKNEVLSFVRSGLEDFSISRTQERAHGWGIPVPGDPSQTLFVWFDALTNYITALGYGGDGKKFKKYWKENPQRVHVIGKGILRFHAVYWPAMLLSARIPLPSEIFVHGYLTVEGQKISKSLGNVVDPYALVEKYGTDPVRYYLLSKFSPFTDGDFSEEKLKAAYNGDLANGLGNLVSRIAKLAEGKEFTAGKGELEISEKYHQALKNYRFDEALSLIWQGIGFLDGYINKEKPWEKEGADRDKDLKLLISHLVPLVSLLQPFLPETAEKIKKQFQGKITPAQPLFPRLS